MNKGRIIRGLGWLAGVALVVMTIIAMRGYYELVTRSEQGGWDEYRFKESIIAFGPLLLFLGSYFAIWSEHCERWLRELLLCIALLSAAWLVLGGIMSGLRHGPWAISPFVLLMVTLSCGAVWSVVTQNRERL